VSRFFVGVQIDLVSLVHEQIFFTTPAAWLRTKTKNVTFEPGSNIFMRESMQFGLNWAIVWCISYVATEGFRDIDECYAAKSYFNLKNSDGTPFAAQTWGDGVKAGVQYLAAHCKIDRLKSVPENHIVFPGTFGAMKKPLVIKTIADLDKLYGDGFGAQVQMFYDQLVAHAKGDVFEKPPTDSVIQPPIRIEPTRPQPIIVPPSTPATSDQPWKKTVKWILGLLSPFVLWIFGFVIPGPIMDIVKQVLIVLKKLFGVE